MKRLAALAAAPLLAVACAAPVAVDAAAPVDAELVLAPPGFRLTVPRAVATAEATLASPHGCTLRLTRFVPAG